MANLLLERSCMDRGVPGDWETTLLEDPDASPMLLAAASVRSNIVSSATKSWMSVGMAEMFSAHGGPPLASWWGLDRNA